MRSATIRPGEALMLCPDGLVESLSPYLDDGIVRPQGVAAEAIAPGSPRFDATALRGPDAAP